MEESTGWRSHLGKRRQICKKDTHICLQIQVLLFSLVFLLVIVRGRTIGKLVSIETTCLVVLSSRFYFWKNRLRWRNPRRIVMGTTDRRGGLVSKHLEILKNGYWNWLSELRNVMAGRTVTGVTDRHRLFRELSLWTLWQSSRMDRRRHDGPSQAA